MRSEARDLALGVRSRASSRGSRASGLSEAIASQMRIRCASGTAWSWALAAEAAFGEWCAGSDRCPERCSRWMACRQRGCRKRTGRETGARCQRSSGRRQSKWFPAGRACDGRRR